MERLRVALENARSSRRDRDADAVIRHCNTAAKILQDSYELKTDDPAVPPTCSPESVFLWSSALYLLAWAYADLERFGRAASVAGVLVAAASNVDPAIASFHPHSAVPILPLVDPAPLAEANRKLIEDMEKRLSKLVEQSNAVVETLAPVELRQDAGVSMLYRITLLEWASAEDGAKSVFRCVLTSEMGLFRRWDLPKGPITVRCSFVTLQKYTEKIMPVPGSPVETCRLDERGHSRFSFSSKELQALTAKFPQLHVLFECDSTMVPLLKGPLSFPPEEAELSTYRPISVNWKTGGNAATFVFQERGDAGIHGRMWDSAVLLAQKLPTLIEAFLSSLAKDVPHLRIMDLGCGVGPVGSIFASSVRNAEVILTDLDVGIELARKNLAFNDDLVRARGSSARAVELVWGDSRTAAQLGSFDVIVAADVAYEVEYFDDLLVSLEELSSTHTTNGLSTELWLVYKRRGLTTKEEARLFGRIESIYERVEGGDLKLGSLAEEVGCKLFRYRRI